MNNLPSKEQEPTIKPGKAEGLPVFGNQMAGELRGFGIIGILAMVVIVLSGSIFIGNIIFPLGALLVLVWVRLSLTPWAAIGYVRPKSWLLSIAGGIALGIVFKLLMKSVVMPILGAEPVNQAYHFLVGNNSMLLVAIWGMLMAGFGEETIFRGFLFERLGKLFGYGIWARTAIIWLTSIVFGLGHYTTQGWTGVEHALIFGLLFGTIYSITGRIFMLMVAHTVFDLTALAIIYWDLETELAQFFFK